MEQHWFEMPVSSFHQTLSDMTWLSHESNVWNAQIKISTQNIFRITVSIFFPLIFGGTGKWKKGNKIKKYFQGIKSQLHQTLAYPLEKKFLDMWTRDNNLAAPPSYLVWACSLYFPVGMKTERTRRSTEPAGDPVLRMPSQGARQVGFSWGSRSPAA